MSICFFRLQCSMYISFHLVSSFHSFVDLRIQSESEIIFTFELSLVTFSFIFPFSLSLWLAWLLPSRFVLSINSSVLCNLFFVVVAHYTIHHCIWAPGHRIQLFCLQSTMSSLVPLFKVIVLSVSFDRLLLFHCAAWFICLSTSVCALALWISCGRW